MKSEGFGRQTVAPCRTACLPNRNSTRNLKSVLQHTT